MKSLFKYLLQKTATVAMDPVWRDLARDIDALRQQLGELVRQSGAGIISQGSKAAQLVLWQHYREMARQGVASLSFADVGFRCHLQFEEDGILLYLFGLIGATNRVAVEICAGDGIQCNTANLIVNHGWWGYLFDGNEMLVRRGVDFYG